MNVAALALCCTLLLPAACTSAPEGAAQDPPPGVPAPAIAAAVSAEPRAALVAPAAPDGVSAAAVQPPAPGLAQPVGTTHALHNVFRLSERLFSGNGPEEPAAFDELAALGIRTILSVDGSTPMVAEAEARGMRYVHVPVTYAQVTPAQRLVISKAVRDLPGPVYVHCHHGKHRGPAAAASAAVTLGMWTPGQAVAYMRQAGTAPSYAGLYACVAGAAPAEPGVLDALPSDFPSIAVPEGLVAAMVKVDIAFEHLGDARDAGWAAPEDHPDLSPAAEAGQLADQFRFAVQTPEGRDLGDGFGAKLAAAVRLATSLEDRLVAGAPREELEAAYKSLQVSCKDCHAAYRDTLP